MSYKPNYDEVTKGYNDALNNLSGGNFTPVKRKREAEQTSIFDKPAGNGYNGDVGNTYKPTYGNVQNQWGANVGANRDLPEYGETQAAKRYSPSYEYKPSYGYAQTMPSFEKGWGTTQSGERMLWEPTYGKTNSFSALWNNQTANTYKPSYGYEKNTQSYTPQQRNEFEIPRMSQTQTQSYRPGEGFITKPENQILRADERKNIKITPLPYKPDEHSGEYEQYSNRTTGFGESELASNDAGARAGTYEVSMLGQSKSDKPEGDERFSEDVREEISFFQQRWLDAETAYSLGIIDIYEKEAIQSAAHNKAEEIRYRADHPYKSFFSDAAEYVIFDLSDLGDISYGTVYAADLTGPALQKMYGNADNLKKIIDAGVAAGAAVHANSRATSIGAVKINGKVVRVDMEYPQGGKPANLHIQVKGREGKTMITSMDDISKLPKGLRKNQALIDIIERGLRNINKLF